ncbi:hypothetical protein EX30DRAFT_339204 [Ascodesmis nigricans]|uniref:Vps41 beta-propeller domain-containing protein n=1 Tax=Ascodesmis nigricans TaxID=341454 RepID=A0A4S2N1R7_9PEZI|nr:hypothetical protein EX30DRAFT_339204 [Ascodesmis nigricans]
MSEPAPEEGKLGADMAGSSEAALELSEERVDTVSERSSAAEEQDQENDGEEEDDDDDDEPRLKYTRLTKSLGSVYRNGDAVSCNLVFADRMVIGTHNGNIHILSLPGLTPIRTYKAHSASITSISISPPPPPPTGLPEKQARTLYNDRHISVATSSIDGLVCVVPLIPAAAPGHGKLTTNIPYSKSEVIAKNFKRPVQAVALSPNFRVDRMFLSGGLAGNLVLSTVPAGGGNWMSLGMGGAKDTILHSGEGAISAIAWSKESPRYVAWTNEQGIKIMRTHIVPPSAQKQGSEELAGNPGIAGWIPGLGSNSRPAGEVAWKRISAIEKPANIPEELAALHKPRLEWIDRRTLLTSEPHDNKPGDLNLKEIDWSDKEKLIIGWSGTVWVMDVFEGNSEPGNEYGWAQITHIFQTDCIIAGIHMYTPSLLLLLAYIAAPEQEEIAEESSVAESSQESESHPRTRRARQRALTPELRFVDLDSSEEVSADELMMSRFESLSVGDYHLGVLPATPNIVQQSEESSGMVAALWGAAINPTQLFSGAASVRSFGSGSKNGSIWTSNSGRVAEEESRHWGPDERGTKIYITSPYDVVFATERSPKDHLGWLLEKEKYEEAWHLIDRMPSVVDSDLETSSVYDEEQKTVVTEGYESDSGSSTHTKTVKKYSVADKEKRRIGEQWLQKLINGNEWTQAGKVCEQVLGTSTRWEHWVWIFEAAGRIEEITPYVPKVHLSPPLPSVIYEIVLAHYLRTDKNKFRDLLLDTWKPEGPRTLYDARTIVDAINRTLDHKEGNVKQGDNNWTILLECLAALYMVLNEPRNALRQYILLKDAEETFHLIREHRLVDAVSNDVASLVLLRLTNDNIENSPISELESLTTEALDLLVDEASKGIISPQKVVDQLSSDSVPLGRLFLFFYLRRLWTREHQHDIQQPTAAGSADTTTAIGSDEGALADFGDLIVSLFAKYDRSLLMRFLRTSHSYSLQTASTVCEKLQYIPELVYLLSKTGQTKRALFLIIDKLGDVSQAIEFAKTQDDPDLWNDLLDYSMDKPRFIRGLLENVGTAIDPITLIRRIPKGLEIEGLKQALGKILKEYGVQWSICDGVAKALKSEVSRGMSELRRGQRRGVKIEIAKQPDPEVPGAFPIEKELMGEKESVEHSSQYCGICQKLFYGIERTPIIAFACTHVFHLSCIAPDAKTRQNDDYDTPQNSHFQRSVSVKVTYAALLRDHLKAGCITCKRRKEAEIVV